MTDNNSCVHLAAVKTVRHPKRRECDERVKTYTYRLGDISALLDRASFAVLDQWAADGFVLTLAAAR